MNTGTGGRDAGRISVLFAIGLTAIMMIIGLSVDGGGRLRETQRAADIAAEAARTGGQQIDVPLAISGGPKLLDADAAQAAVTSYLTAAGATGTVVIAPDRQHITVYVTVVYHTVILAIMGIDTLTATGDATAALITT